MHLDAGTLASPLADGFDALHLEGSDDSRVRWLDDPRPGEVRGFPDPLTADGLIGGTLHLSLEPGTWRVWALLGQVGEDPYGWADVDRFGLEVVGQDGLSVDIPRPWPAFVASAVVRPNPRPVFLPDQTSWDRQIGPAHPWRETTVEVGADGLTLTPFGRPLQALVAWPDDAGADAAIDLALIDAARKSWYHLHHEPSEWEHPPPFTSAGALSAQVGMLHTAPGAPLHRLVTLQGGDAPGTVRIEGLEALAPSVREVSWLDAAGHPSKKTRPRPVVIGPPTDHWTGGQGLPPTLALHLGVPAEAPPGRHRGWLVLGRDGRNTRVRLDVTVHDVHLGPSLPVGVFLQVPQDATLRAGFGSPEVLDLLDQTMDLLAARGTTALALRYATWPESEDPSVFMHVADGWSRRGGELLVWSDPKVALRGAAYVRPTGPLLPASALPALRAALALAADAPLPVAIHLYEEEGQKNLDAVPRGRALAEAVRQLDPSVRLLATMPHPADAAAADAFDQVTFTAWPTPDPERFAAARARGASAWAYNLAPGRSGPLLAWALGADGLLQWHWQPRTGDPHAPLHRPAPWFHGLIDRDGRVRATPQADHLAEGIVDVRVLTSLAAVATGGGRHAREATGLLDAMRAALLDPHPSEDGALLSDEVLDAARRRSLILLSQSASQ